MPQLGETVAEGTVIKWLRRQGEMVAADEPLVEIQTDKVSMEVPSLRTGRLTEILVAEGETVPVGAPLAWLETDGTAPESGDVAAATPTSTQPAAPESVAGRVPSSAAAGVGDGPRPTPLVRRLLDEAGLAAADVVATGPGGRIRREDVAAAVAARAGTSPAAASPPAAQPSVAASPSTAVTPPAAPLPVPVPVDGSGDRTQPLSRVRKVIAERMVASLQTSAQLTSVVEVDVTRVAEVRKRVNDRPTSGARLSFLPFFIVAVVEALRAHADLNASVDADAGTVTRHQSVHMAIAVDTEAGLMAPVIRDAGRLSIMGLAHAVADVAGRARSGRLAADDLAGGTFTITNTGSRGALFDTPIINQPQVGILATGAVVRRPVVVVDPSSGSEGIAIRSMMFLALTYDHRLVDGALAAAFLVDVKTRLEEGRFESELGLPHE